MELMFVTLGGVAIGLLFRYLVPGRREHGVLLIPAIGAVSAAVAWAVLTWVGLSFDGGWIWTISLLMSVVLAVVVAVVLPAHRRSHDAAMLSTLMQA